MSNNQELKKQVVSDIVAKFQQAQSVVVVKYSGLTVEQVTELRAQCRANGVDYCVLKNTLVRRALNELGIEGMDDVLHGPSAFAFGATDAVAPAKVLDEFVTKTKTEAIEVKAGLLGREVMTPADVKNLASVPSREVLLSRLVGSLQSSISSFVRVLDAISKKNGESAPEA